MTKSMKSDLKINLFWCIVWAVILGCAILGFFWQPALYIIAGVAAIMFGIFFSDYIYVSKF